MPISSLFEEKGLAEIETWRECRKVLLVQSAKVPQSLIVYLQQKNCFLVFISSKNKRLLCAKIKEHEPFLIVAPIGLEQCVESSLKELELERKPLQIFFPPTLTRQDHQLKFYELTKLKKISLKPCQTTLEDKILTQTIGVDDVLFYFHKSKKSLILPLATGWMNKKVQSLSIGKKKLFFSFNRCQGDIYVMLPEKKTLGMHEKKKIQSLEKKIQAYVRLHPEKKIYLQTYRDSSLEPWNYAIDPKLVFSLQRGKKLFRKEEKAFFYLKETHSSLMIATP